MGFAIGFPNTSRIKTRPVSVFEDTRIIRGVGKGRRDPGSVFEDKRIIRDLNAAGRAAKSNRTMMPAARRTTGSPRAQAPHVSEPTAPMPPAPGRPAGKSPGARGRAQRNTAAGRTSGRDTANAQVDKTAQNDPIATMYGAARRSLDAESERMDAIRQQRIADMAKFDQYMAQARAASNTTLQQQYAASAADARSAQANGDQRINDLIAQARAQVSGGALDASGITANQESFGFQQKADGAAAASNAFDQANLMTRNVERQDEDFARSQSMRDNLDSRYNTWLSDLSKKRSDLVLQEGQDRFKQQAADRQFALDARAAQFLEDYKRSQLGIAQTNAETARIKAINTANFNRETLKLRAKIADGQMSLSQARLELQARLGKANIAQKERDRLTKIGIAKLNAAARFTAAQARAAGVKASGTAAKNPSEGAVDTVKSFLSDTLANTYGGKTWDKVDDHGKSETVRGAITALATENPGMSSVAALQVLTSVFGGPLMTSNPQYRSMVESMFQ